MIKEFPRCRERLLASTTSPARRSTWRFTPRPLQQVAGSQRSLTLGWDDLVEVIPALVHGAADLVEVRLEVSPNDGVRSPWASWSSRVRKDKVHVVSSHTDSTGAGDRTDMSGVVDKLEHGVHLYGPVGMVDGVPVGEL